VSKYRERIRNSHLVWIPESRISGKSQRPRNKFYTR
jgi:hypothetical protein